MTMRTFNLIADLLRTSFLIRIATSTRIYGFANVCFLKLMNSVISHASKAIFRTIDF